MKTNVGLICFALCWADANQKLSIEMQAPRKRARPHWVLDVVRSLRLYLGWGISGKPEKRLPQAAVDEAGMGRLPFLRL